MINPDSATFIFPLSPSVNHYWGQRGKIRFLTAKAKDFKREVSIIVGNQNVHFGDAKLSIQIIVNFPDKRRRDIDNILKGTFDAMCSSGLFDDDSQIDELTIQRGEIIKGGLMKVTIKKIACN